MPPWMVKKLAGVPVWGWGIAALGAIALGLYFRHRAVVASSTDSSAGSGMDGLTNALAGGTPDSGAAGLDPALADLLSSALGAFNTGPGFDAGSGVGFDDGGGFFDTGSGASDGGDTGGSSGGQDAGGNTSVAASGAGTTWSPGAGYTGGGFLTLKQFSAGQAVSPYAGATAQHPGANVSGVVSPRPSTSVQVGGNYAGGYTTYSAPPHFSPLSAAAEPIRVSRSGFTAL